MSDDDFVQQIKNQAQLTEEEEQSAGQPVKGYIEEEHRQFLGTLFELIDNGEVDVNDQQSFLKKDVYDTLDEEWKDKTDLALVNIANQIKLIDTFRKDENNPEESPQLQTMVEQLWQMKQRIEEHYDVFKF